MLPKKSPKSARFTLALALSCAVIAGCVFPGQLVGPSVTRVRDLTVEGARLVTQGQTTSLKVTIGTALATQAFSLDWTRAEITLSNATLLNTPLTRGVTQAGGGSISASTANFTGLRPGSGYSLTVALYDGDDEVATGTNSSISLGAGSNTVQVTVSPTATPTPSPARFLNVDTLFTDENRPPMGIHVANNGDLYVAEAGPDGQIWRVDSSGNRTPWGPPVGAYIGDLVPAPDGDFYVSEATIGGRVLRVSQSGAKTVFATGFAYPIGLAIDPAGNLYVADENHGSVAKVTPDGSTDHVFYLDPQQPHDVTVDAHGNLYVSFMSAGYIVKIQTDGSTSTYAQNLSYPFGLCTDASGNLYVGVAGQILKVSPSQEVTTVAGSDSDLAAVDGPSAVARFGAVGPVAINPAGTILYATDYYFGSLRKIE